MANKAHEYPARVLCPLVAREITDTECIETQDVAEKILKADVLPDEFKRHENWRDLCKACKFHEND